MKLVKHAWNRVLCLPTPTSFLMKCNYLSVTIGVAAFSFCFFFLSILRTIVYRYVYCLITTPPFFTLSSRCLGRHYECCSLVLNYPVHVGCIVPVMESESKTSACLQVLAGGRRFKRSLLIFHLLLSLS